MSKQAINALSRKNKKQEKLEELEQEIKALEEKAQTEIGKYIMKEWEIKSDQENEKVFSVIHELKDEAKSRLKEKEDGMGKSDM